MGRDVSVLVKLGVVDCIYSKCNRQLGNLPKRGWGMFGAQNRNSRGKGGVWLGHSRGNDL